MGEIHFVREQSSICTILWTLKVSHLSNQHVVASGYGCHSLKKKKKKLVVPCIEWMLAMDVRNNTKRRMVEGEAVLGDR